MSYLPKKLQPIIVPKPWGGSHLDSFRDNSRYSQPVGELVLYSTLDIFPVTVHVADRKIPAREYTCQFAFMIKLLSTTEPLSLQNHPADEDIEALGLTGYGKDESWLILDAAEDAEIFLGFKAGLGGDVLTRLDEHPDPLSLFQSYRPQIGDIYYLPAGLIHGTRGQIMLYEIQQPSDHTFRIHDFGRGRELHLEYASRVYRSHPPQVFQTGKFSNGKFSFETETLDGAYPWRHYFDRDEIVTWLGTPGCILDGDERAPLRFADTFLAEKGNSLILQGQGILVRAFQ